MKSNSNATTSESVSIQITKHNRCSIFLQILSFSRTHARLHAHKHTCDRALARSGSYLCDSIWRSGSLGLSPLFTLSKWIGNTSALYEIMFCMRFDVACFWWQKQKYCFFTAYPTHFVNRYCANVAGATIFSTRIHSHAHSVRLAYCCLALCHWYFAPCGCCCHCFERWTWYECYVVSVVHVVCIVYIV